MASAAYLRWCGRPTLRLAAHSCAALAPQQTRHLARSATLAMIKIGDTLPAATLYEGSPANSVSTTKLCKDKTVVLFGVPGAFTPACSQGALTMISAAMHLLQTHLPGYIEQADAMKAAGVDEIVCMAVNDPFVTEGWAEANGAGGKVRILSDVKCELTTAMGLQLDLADVLGTVRCKRFSMILKDGVVTSLDVEPDGKGLSCSLAGVLAKKLAKK